LQVRPIDLNYGCDTATHRFGTRTLVRGDGSLQGTKALRRLALAGDIARHIAGARCFQVIRTETSGAILEQNHEKLKT